MISLKVLGRRVAVDDGVGVVGRRNGMMRVGDLLLRVDGGRGGKKLLGRERRLEILAVLMAVCPAAEMLVVESALVMMLLTDCDVSN